MKPSSLITLLLSGGLFWAGSTHAASDDCKDMARELTMAASNEVLTDMTASQRSELQEVALAICERHVTNTTTTADTNDSGSDDWFSDRVLNGEPADKPGNKRLERRRRQ